MKKLIIVLMLLVFASFVSGEIDLSTEEGVKEALRIGINERKMASKNEI